MFGMFFGNTVYRCSFIQLFVHPVGSTHCWLACLFFYFQLYCAHGWSHWL